MSSLRITTSTPSHITPSAASARIIAHRVPAELVSKVLCHRELDGVAQFLVRWTTPKEPLVPRRAFASWHSLDELGLALHFVQAYIEGLPAPGSLATRNAALAHAATSTESRPLKRRAPGVDDVSRDTPVNTGLLTPLPSHLSASRSASVSSVDIAPSEADDQPDWREINVYNGILQKSEGRITAKKSKFANVATINASRLPTQQMLEHAIATPGPVTAAERVIRNAFMEKLRSVKGVYLENEVDGTTPSLDFEFIDKFVLREGVTASDPETYVGCEYPCRPHMGAYRGCEYTKLCTCLEYAAVDEERLEKKDPTRYEQYREEKESGGFVDLEGLPKRFPYSSPGEGGTPILQAFYREQRHPIYECNANCNCGPVCKSRLVQKGRRVELTIFKTPNRGWGVHCNEDLVTGEFIDVYLGEVLTNKETSRREDAADADKGSYLYSLDKFVGDDNAPTEDTHYVVDGQYMGNATRFINHSCEPNCRQYTVSENKYDTSVYHLAFFAYEDIPAGTELTFDYMDKDEEEEEEVLRKRELAELDPKNKDKRPCNCGALKCRGYLWV